MLATASCCTNAVVLGATRAILPPLCDTYAGRVTREAAPQAFRANRQLSTTKE